MSIKKLDALIIDNDLDVRMRLRQAMLSVVNFGTVDQVSSLKEAKERIQEADGKSYHLIFLSNRFPLEAVVPFADLAKREKVTEDAAFVLVLPARAKKSSDLARMLVAGVDGFLFEPYSVDELVEMAELAARVSKERAAAREAMAARLIIREMIATIDAISRLMACGYNCEPAMQRLRKLCAPLQKLQAEALQAYFARLVLVFGWVPIPDRSFERFKYLGSSMRVKKRMASLISQESERLAEESIDIEQSLGSR